MLDTLTHALSGALIGRATAPRNPGPAELPIGRRMFVGARGGGVPRPRLRHELSLAALISVSPSRHHAFGSAAAAVGGADRAHLRGVVALETRLARVFRHRGDRPRRAHRGRSHHVFRHDDLRAVCPMRVTASARRSSSISGSPGSSSPGSSRARSGGVTRVRVAALAVLALTSAFSGDAAARDRFRRELRAAKARRTAGHRDAAAGLAVQLDGVRRGRTGYRYAHVNLMRKRRGRSRRPNRFRRAARRAYRPLAMRSGSTPRASADRQRRGARARGLRAAGLSFLPLVRGISRAAHSTAVIPSVRVVSRPALHHARARQRLSATACAAKATGRGSRSSSWATRGWSSTETSFSPWPRTLGREC